MKTAVPARTTKAAATCRWVANGTVVRVVIGLVNVLSPLIGLDRGTGDPTLAGRIGFVAAAMLGGSA